MKLIRLGLHGFKSFAHKNEFTFDSPVTGIVGPNGSGKSNVVEAIRFVLGEQSVKSLRGKTGADLIYKGSSKLGKMARATVEITFDNRERRFVLSTTQAQEISLDFDEITISRTVFSDASNTFMINGSEVRMKDIHELIASVNIGSSGHHIINQGETDRLLNAHARERRSMVEESLGLKLYHYRIKEADRKLSRTQDNLLIAQASRSELEPHLRFLKKQVEKVERAKSLVSELLQAYTIYLAREQHFVAKESEQYIQEKQSLEEQKQKLDNELAEIRRRIDAEAHNDQEREVSDIQQNIEQASDIRDECARSQSRLDGMIETTERSIARLRSKQEREHHSPIPFEDVEILVNSIIEETHVDETATLETLRSRLISVRATLSSFLKEKTDVQKMHDQDIDQLEQELTHMRQQKDKEVIRLVDAEKNVRILIEQRDTLVAQNRVERADMRELEQSIFKLSTSRSDIAGKLSAVTMNLENCDRRERNFQEELKEGEILVGSEIFLYTEKEVDLSEISREKQEVARRDLERMKIKLEEIGGGSHADILQEYKDAEERDAFLAHEIHDLSESMQSLNGVISDLQNHLNSEFQQGVEKINEQFQEFFSRMFGGGQARLKIIDVEKRKKKNKDEMGELLEHEEMFDEDEKEELGLDIQVTLPRKKVADLDMLSGGERSLTSIALLFALSQVNPPPFLVLDETDAALDEANSKKYGDMIERLSAYSQLIVVTHNRETMSRAAILYGVTLAQDGASQLLSVKFAEAAQYAK